jgi:hypothetical protein
MKDNAPAALEDVIVPSFRTFRLCGIHGSAAGRQHVRSSWRQAHRSRRVSRGGAERRPGRTCRHSPHAHRPNVKAIWDDIDRITPSGLITRGSERFLHHDCWEQVPVAPNTIKIMCWTSITCSSPRASTQYVLYRSEGTELHSAWGTPRSLSRNTPSR